MSGSIKQSCWHEEAAAFERAGILVEEGRERVQRELQGVPQNVIREVCKAAHLPVATPTGQTFVVAELRSAVLALFAQPMPDEQDEAGCVES